MLELEATAGDNARKGTGCHDNVTCMSVARHTFWLLWLKRRVCQALHGSAGWQLLFSIIVFSCSGQEVGDDGAGCGRGLKALCDTSQKC